jgi:hypothetical protein
MRYAEDVVEDVRQGFVAREFADLTPGFGTYHPQDVRRDQVFGDPSPIPNARTPDRENWSKQDLGYTDQEIEASIREGRPPRGRRHARQSPA